MDAIKRAARKFWGWYRRQRLWVQIVIGVVVASVIFGPIIEATDKSNDKQEQSQETLAPTTAARSTTVATTAPPATSAASTTSKPAASTTSTTTTTPLTSFTGLNPSRIFAKDFNPWPFSVDTGLLGCPEGSAVVFQTDGADGAIWAINGSARTIAERRGWKDIYEGDLWLDNRSISGTKVNIGKVLDLGLTLCD